MPESPIQEALRLANADKASVLTRIETEIASANVLPNTGQINELLKAGRLGALYTLKEIFIAAGWIEPRAPSFAFSEDDCPGHVASDFNAKVCGRCGIHIDSFRSEADDTANPTF